MTSWEKHQNNRVNYCLIVSASTPHSNQSRYVLRSNLPTLRRAVMAKRHTDQEWKSLKIFAVMIAPRSRGRYAHRQSLTTAVWAILKHVAIRCNKGCEPRQLALRGRSLTLLPRQLTWKELAIPLRYFP